MKRFAKIAVGAALVVVGGCKDSTDFSEAQAQKNVAATAALATKDVAEVRRGLPKGGPALSEALFVAEAGHPILPTRARAALKTTRERVTDLQLAKSTFFAVTDPAGVALGSDQETDSIAGKNFLTAFPALAKAKDGYVETTGTMEETRGVRQGPDATWAAAAPVVAKDGALSGLYVTGWSLRKFAYHLESQLKSDLRQEKGKDGNPSKMPVLYVFVVMGDQAYSAPVTPEVNVKAIEDLKLSTKLGGEAPWHGKVEVTNRPYGVAAQRVKDLCETCAVAVLRSEI